MNRFTSFALLLVPFFMSTSYAETKAAPKAAAKTQQPAEDKALKQFNDTVAVKFIGIGATNENGEVVMQFKYAIENKAKKAIKRIEWVSRYLHNQQLILEQDVPVSFEKGLNAKKTEGVIFSLPFNQLPPAAQQTFATKEVTISAQFLAKSITFADGSQIQVDK